MQPWTGTPHAPPKRRVSRAFAGPSETPHPSVEAYSGPHSFYELRTVITAVDCSRLLAVEISFILSLRRLSRLVDLIRYAHDEREAGALRRSRRVTAARRSHPLAPTFANYYFGRVGRFRTVPMID
ncbi:hypothetical protein EVAR_30516_1 [Eumeta japonica]|uniref:Uncharacterized protein n=1 Tax=Eumeta variegata TaxID=151549 RepID=A0A4C1VZE1_EUMVA|nr:hypothetical protein EVAR_30516_1 [Eumeta japonica]